MKLVFISLGWIFTAVGLVGAFVPILPTTPFLLLAAFFFARGSTKFHDWLTYSNFYQKHIESSINDGQMAVKTKIRIVVTAYTMLIIPFLLTQSTLLRIIIISSMIIIMVTFTLFIKNKPES
jgi:uncharacterized membrane protein YbaN (DUF454 family)